MNFKSKIWIRNTGLRVRLEDLMFCSIFNQAKSLALMANVSADRSVKSTDTPGWYSLDFKVFFYLLLVNNK